MRALVDEDFSSWVLKVGNSTVECPEGIKKTQHSILIPSKFISKNIVTDVFGVTFTTQDVLSISKRAVLCPKNDHVRLLNESVLARLNAEEVSYYSIDSMVIDDDSFNQAQVNFPVEFLNTLNPSGMPPHKLNLKKGCIVLLLRNLSIKNGLCNGTRLAIRDFRANVIQAESLTGSQRGKIHFIPRIFLDSSNDPALPFNFKRHQFPLRLAYAMTINKSQGQTFEKVGLFLPEPCFTHGQLYTAMSRVACSSDCKIDVSSGPKQEVTPQGIVTENLVYKEVLM